MKQIVLAYIKDGYIKSKCYFDTNSDIGNINRDWAMLKKTKYPIFYLKGNDIQELFVKERKNTFKKSIPVPYDCWPQMIQNDDDMCRLSGDNYLGCCFDYCKDMDVWIADYQDLMPEGCKRHYCKIFDRHGNSLCFIRFE